jgi:hypothetical protein
MQTAAVEHLVARANAKQREAQRTAPKGAVQNIYPRMRISIERASTP